MKKAITAAEMSALDKYTIEEAGIPSCVLMERASLSVACEIESLFEPGAKIAAVCGSGNNGGDGVAAARMLFLRGYDVQVYILGDPAHRTEELKRQIRIAEHYGVAVQDGSGSLDDRDVIIDAVFGIGLSREVSGSYAQVIEEMNSASAFVVAVDIPSGIHADTGQVMGCAVSADLTVTFAFPKPGHLLYPGREFTGELSVADIGICETDAHPVRNPVFLQEEADLIAATYRPPGGNKGTFGKILVAGGSPGMCGAVFLSALGAFRAGAGMVRILTVEENRVPLQSLLPEAMFTAFPKLSDAAVSEDTPVPSMEDPGLRKVIDWCDALVLGPGLGTGEEAERIAEWVLKNSFEKKMPTVIDADGLNLLAGHPSWKQYIHDKMVLTPHPGEMARLCGNSIADIQSDPLANAARAAAEFGCTVVQKDAPTVVASPDGRRWINLSGNDGMATAGSGDVLSGVTAAMLCSKATAGAAASAVYLHGLGGDEAAGKRGRHGMTARDIAEGTAEVLRELWNQTEE